MVSVILDKPIVENPHIFIISLHMIDLSASKLASALNSLDLSLIWPVVFHLKG
jgi:hypothetical protein